MSGTLTVSAGVITDAVRADMASDSDAGESSDGLSDDSSFGVWEATTNLVRNGGLETNTTDWAAAGGAGAAIARTTAQHKFGLAALQVDTDTTGTNRGCLYGSPSAVTGLSAATTYTFSVWLKGNAGSETVFLQINWQTGAGAGISSTTGSNVTLTTEWQRFTLTGTSPATTAQATLRIQNPNATVQRWFVDGAQLEQQPLATPYVETDGSSQTRAAGRVQCPVAGSDGALLDETSGAVLVLLRMGWDESTPPNTDNTVIAWHDDANNWLGVWRDGSNWNLRRVAAGASSTAARAGSNWSKGDLRTVLAAWTATQLKVGVDGAAMATQANTNIPTLAATSFDFGTRLLGSGREIDSDFKFAATFDSGSITDAEWAALYARVQEGDCAPEDLSAICANATCTATFPFDTASFMDENFHHVLDRADTHPAVRVDIDFDNDPTSDTRTWEDVTEYVEQLNITRGRENELSRTNPGVLRAVLANRDRRFDPTYTDGPYYPGVKPMRRIRVRARWELVDYNLFHGFVEDWPQEWPEQGIDARVPLQAVDAFKTLNLHQLDDAVYTAQLTGTRMGTVLTTAGFGTAWRFLDAGQSTVGGGTVNSSVLEHVLNVVESENGVFFQDGGGSVIFQDRHHRTLNETSAAGTVGDEATEIRYGDVAALYGDSQIWNHVQVTPAGGTTESVIDTASTASYFKRTLAWPPGGSYLVTSQTEALSAAQYLVNRYKDPHLHIPRVELVGARDTTQWPTILGLEISNRVVYRFRHPAGGTITEDEHVEAIEHRISPDGDWRVGLKLSAADPQSYWVLGDATNSQLGVTTRLAY